MQSFELQVQEIRHPESVFKLQVRWWDTIKGIKDQLRSQTHAKPSQIRIFHPSEPIELRNTITLHDIGLDSSRNIVLRAAIDNVIDNPTYVLTYSDAAELDDSCLHMMKAIQNGLERNKIPAKTDVFDGTSGVYFMRSVSNAYVAVFKPRDEEQGMPNNPKDHADIGDASLREDFKPGEGCFREQAAYIMDKGNFSGVPPTMLVHCEHPVFNYPKHIRGKVQSGPVKPYPKYGSMQMYMRSEDSFENFGRGFFSDIEVQKIALLDMRLLNCDRNSANILVHRKSHHEHDTGSPSANNGVLFGSEDLDQNFLDASPHHYSGDDYYLIPIDHGYALPSRVKIFQWDWSWYDYNQVARPVHPSIREYMKTLDIDEILRELRAQVALPEDSYMLVRLAHQLLVEGIEAGLTLKDMADIIARDEEDELSRLEHAIYESEQNARRSMELHHASTTGNGSSREGHSSSSSASLPNGNGHTMAIHSASKCNNTMESLERKVSRAITTCDEADEIPLLHLPSVLSPRLQPTLNPVPEHDHDHEHDEQSGKQHSGKQSSVKASDGLTVSNTSNGAEGTSNGSGCGCGSVSNSSSNNSSGDEHDMHKQRRDSQASSTSSSTNESILAESPLSTPALFQSLARPLAGQPVKHLRTYDCSEGQSSKSQNVTNGTTSTVSITTSSPVYVTRPLQRTSSEAPSFIEVPDEVSIPIQVPSINSFRSAAAASVSVPVPSRRETMKNSSTSCDLMSLGGSIDNLSRARSPHCSNSEKSNNSDVSECNSGSPISRTLHIPTDYHLSRAVSFTAMESDPIFELKAVNTHRTNSMFLKRQRNKKLENTADYREQRLIFAQKHISQLVVRVAKQLGRKKLN
mmetsp:Transcript_19863/g.19972  ORF Transcript_19863/g.19972 Transcript_19863/m.19972 type:complete len:859 (+) Transcript_19863:486-3062(+)